MISPKFLLESLKELSWDFACHLHQFLQNFKSILLDEITIWNIVKNSATNVLLKLKNLELFDQEQDNSALTCLNICRVVFT